MLALTPFQDDAVLIECFVHCICRYSCTWTTVKFETQRVQLAKQFHELVALLTDYQ